MKLTTDQVAFHPFSYGDWSGRVFLWEGDLYRAIRAERAAFYEHLFSKGVLRDLIRRQLLVDTEIADLQIDGYALALKHRTIPFVSHCYDWCGEMLKAAALSVLELERELLKHGLTLQDAHPYNVLFDGPKPVWVDLGSLALAGQGEPWQAYEQFQAFFTRPLKIMAAGHAEIGHGLLRCLLRHDDSGILQRDAEAIIGTAGIDMVRVAKMKAKAAAKKAIPSIFRPLASRVVRSMPFSGTMNPISSIENAIQEIQNIRLARPSATDSNCHGLAFPDLVATTGWTHKQRSVAQILAAKKPGSVLDIGAGHGWYSQLAARSGAQVISVDFDETSVTGLFFDAVAGQLPILPLVTDFRSMNPLMAWANVPGDAYVDRLHCDMVLALALVHYLAFEQRLNFEIITRGLSAFAGTCLVVEFIDREDTYVRKRLSDRFAWYNLEGFTSALRREFRDVEKLPSDAEHRCVLLCER